MALEFLSEYWENHGFNILLILSILFLIVYAFTRLGKKGTWNTSVSLPTKSKKKIVTESRGEIMCRNVLENLLHEPFPKVRPAFLKNPVTNNRYNLELDCYNEKLKLAVEYNGIQHYSFSPHFHKNYEAFLNQKYRDEMKKMKCKELGITLIEVPYTVKVEDIPDYLQQKLIKLNYI